MKEIIIIGRGKLAKSFFNNFANYSDIPVKPYSSDIEPDRNSIFLHIGSGRQYRESLGCAVRNGSPFIQAATEKDIQMSPPSEQSILYIEAPNLDLKIIQLLHLLKNTAEIYKGEPVCITESHQKDKKSVPGTARKFCEYLKVPLSDLVSIRNTAKQRELGIKNLDQHAYHRIEIGQGDSLIRIETKVEGSESYLKGLAKIVPGLSGLPKGHYMIEDLLDGPGFFSQEGN